ncbi:MAG: PTS sugar transporter subunit IIA [Candidatus Muiribacteriota bacterium]
MEIDSLLKEKFIFLNPKSETKGEMLRELCDFAFQTGIVTDKNEFFEVIENREKLGSTGIGKNIAIPHGRCECVKDLSLILVRHSKGIDFDSLDGKPARIFFLLAAPINVESKYLQVLANLSMLLRRDEFRKAILDAVTAEEIMDILRKK